MKEQIIAALKNVYDPEIPVNIWDLGLIYDIAADGGRADIKMTMTSPTCPMSEEIMEMARAEIAKIPGISEININLVWEPAWDLSKMSDAAKLELDLTGMGW
jgi:FeS assembly SUF system protein